MRGGEGRAGQGSDLVVVSALLRQRGVGCAHSGAQVEQLVAYLRCVWEGEGGGAGRVVRVTCNVMAAV